MSVTFGMAMLLAREIFGVPVDLGLAVVAIGAMVVLAVWGSRPSVIAKYPKREDADGREDAPKREPPAT
jgi:hypothetical protein